jgi:septal ring factor EnvC (AmiA/AmiB activator)
LYKSEIKLNHLSIPKEELKQMKKDVKFYTNQVNIDEAYKVLDDLKKSIIKYKKNIEKYEEEFKERKEELKSDSKEKDKLLGKINATKVKRDINKEKIKAEKKIIAPFYNFENESNNREMIYKKQVA